MTSQIIFRGFSYTYEGSDSPALKDINVEIRTGEFVLLVGPSGCGKSTLLRAICGLIPHHYRGTWTGEVTVDGLRVSETPIPALVRCVGFLSQNPEDHIFMFSVKRDIVFGLENLGYSREEISKRLESVLSLLEIRGLEDKPVHELSDGQKQRVALAGILAVDPKVILLDEPTSLLDPRTALEVSEIVRRLNRERGVTVVLVEHKLDVFSRFASRTIVMNGGRIVGDGDTKEVLERKETLLHGVPVPMAFRIRSIIKESWRGGFR